MPISLGIGVLNFAALLHLALAAKKDSQWDISAACGLGAYGCLAWGILGWVWSLLSAA
jgi:hypothetical protein